MQLQQKITTTAPATERPRYRPIGEYGVIGDCRTAALVAPDGAIDWCCLPHFDSPAVFCRLLDARIGGFFRISPVEAFESTMSYLDGTNVLQTMETTTTGRLRVVDFMPIRKRQAPVSLPRRLTSALLRHPRGVNGGLERELGNDVAAAHRINRIVSCVGGEMTIEIVLKATFDWARTEASMQIEPLADGGVGLILTTSDRTLVAVFRYIGTIPQHALSSPLTVESHDGTLVTRVHLRSGHRVAAVLNYARDDAEARAVLNDLKQHDFDRDLDETLSYWRTWSAQANYTGPYQDIVLRSALALKLCIFEPTGAIVAAPTTSLPEEIGGVRNWDYRFTWLRDSTFTLGALADLGYHDEARDYFHFIHDLRIHQIKDLSIMYSIRGEHGEQLREVSLDHLEGYKGSHPVRVGNGAATQHQLDVYGELLDAAYSYIQNEGFYRRIGGSLLKRDLREFSGLLADYVTEHWQEKDQGIWEVRGEPRAFVYSRGMCWLALKRACELAERHGHQHRAVRWGQARDALHEDILAHGYSTDLQTLTQTYDGQNADAANLRLALARFLPPEDARMRSTIEVTGKLLGGERRLLYRYEPLHAQPSDDKRQDEHEVDGLPGGEGAFLACTFWYISSLCHIGRLDEARDLFEEIVGLASPLGLYSEEINPHTKELLGNYPQAFTHIGLINSAATLLRAQEGRLMMTPDETTRG